jgi:hypothetical protein
MDGDGAARRNWIVRHKVIAGGVALVVLGIVAAAAASTGKGPTNSANSAVTTTSPSPTYSPPLEETAPPTSYDTPQLSDFSVKLKTISKQCFGSIGCNWVVQVKLSEFGSLSLDPSVTYYLTYRLTGDESGAIIGTIDVTGDQYSVEDGNEIISTKANAIIPKITLTELST